MIYDTLHNSVFIGLEIGHLRPSWLAQLFENLECRPKMQFSAPVHTFLSDFLTE